METLSELAQNVKMTCHRVDYLPVPDDMHEKSSAWQCRLSYQGRNATFVYFMGPLCVGNPKADELLSSLLLDAEALDQDFEDWAGEVGFSSDSIKAQKIWRACRRNGLRLKALLGDEWELFRLVENDV